MTLKAIKFTPEVMLEAPRRTPAVPSPDGTRALFMVTSYDFEAHKKTSQLRVLDIETAQSRVLVENSGASEPTWIGDDEFLYLKGADKGKTVLVVDSVSNPGGDL
jgi:hypothetical protein